MKKTVLISGLVALMLSFSSCATKNNFGYEMKCLGVGSEGSNLVKIYS